MQNLARQNWLRCAAICVVVALPACGSDTMLDGPSGPQIGVNRSPAMTSATSANVPENSTGTVYAAAAEEPAGDALIYTHEGTHA